MEATRRCGMLKSEGPCSHLVGQSAFWGGLHQLRATGLGGTVSEVVDKIGQFAEAGASRIYFQILDLHDLDHLDLIAAEVVPQL